MADYKESQASLDGAAQEVRVLSPQPPTTPPAKDADKRGWWDKIKDGVSSNLPSFNVNFDAIAKSAEKLPERVIRLIVIFVLQTMIIPVFLLWALYRLALGVAHPARYAG